MTEYDYQVIDSDGEVHNYIWDNKKRTMVEGKRPNSVPWWRLHQIAKELGGELHHYTCCDRTTEHNKIVIEYNHKPKEK